MHDILTKTSRHLELPISYLALQIVEGLGVHSPEHPTLTPVPSQEFVQRSIEREAIRRIFWLIHLLDVMASIYFKKPVTFTDSELRLRLPVDETSFELGVHSTLPDPETASNPSAMLMEAENKMKEWDRTLPEHLRFSEQSLQVQQSMFETSSNTGAWCWCNIHIHHASSVLALHTGRRPRPDASEALRKIDLILQMLGDRAKNSILSCVFFIDLWVLLFGLLSSIGSGMTLRFANGLMNTRKVGVLQLLSLCKTGVPIRPLRNSTSTLIHILNNPSSSTRTILLMDIPNSHIGDFLMFVILALR
ncbi:hypothetical protein NLJ89_g11892 [Agrocybe chaxingu]|uniref:Xylanolytic transcriptional activator regulatory domain-containing protein n=1 Tax=Agrocybe chaxingu TaxID=84603 RepID=A0A9W8MNZ9_9AGAR|nr:hypothetical protein NLJ89_g11892 [Agrocybe chaxingu]